MKKIRTNSKKGFTLVELIVVLVILAVMAAMLIPALTGYIREARREKDYQAAATVLTAVQSLATKGYAEDDCSRYVTESNIEDLAGVEIASFSNFQCDTNGIVTGFQVQFRSGEATYVYNGQASGSSMWSVNS